VVDGPIKVGDLLVDPLGTRGEVVNYRPWQRAEYGYVIIKWEGARNARVHSVDDVIQRMSRVPALQREGEW